MKRKLASLLIVATMLFTLAGCGGGTADNESAATENSAASESESAASAEATTISVGVPTAPPALPVLHMIEDNLLGEDVTIELATWNAPEELLPWSRAASMISTPFRSPSSPPFIIKGWMCG